MDIAISSHRLAHGSATSHGAATSPGAGRHAPGTGSGAGQGAPVPNSVPSNLPLPPGAMAQGPYPGSELASLGHAHLSGQVALMRQSSQSSPFSPGGGGGGGSGGGVSGPANSYLGNHHPLLNHPALHHHHHHSNHLLSPVLNPSLSPFGIPSSLVAPEPPPPPPPSSSSSSFSSPPPSASANKTGGSSHSQNSSLAAAAASLLGLAATRPPPQEQRPAAPGISIPAASAREPVMTPSNPRRHLLQRQAAQYIGGNGEMSSTSGGGGGGGGGDVDGREIPYDDAATAAAAVERRRRDAEDDGVFSEKARRFSTSGVERPDDRPYAGSNPDLSTGEDGFSTPTQMVKGRGVEVITSRATDVFSEVPPQRRPPPSPPQPRRQQSFYSVEGGRNLGVAADASPSPPSMGSRRHPHAQRNHHSHHYSYEKPTIASTKPALGGGGGGGGNGGGGAEFARGGGGGGGGVSPRSGGGGREEERASAAASTSSTIAITTQNDKYESTSSFSSSSSSSARAEDFLSTLCSSFSSSVAVPSSSSSSSSSSIVSSFQNHHSITSVAPRFSARSTDVCQLQPTQNPLQRQRPQQQIEQEQQLLQQRTIRPKPPRHSRHPRLDDAYGSGAPIDETFANNGVLGATPLTFPVDAGGIGSGRPRGGVGIYDAGDENSAESSQVTALGRNVDAGFADSDETRIAGDDRDEEEDDVDESRQKIETRNHNNNNNNDHCSNDKNVEATDTYPENLTFEATTLSATTPSADASSIGWDARTLAASAQDAAVDAGLNPHRSAASFGRLETPFLHRRVGGAATPYFDEAGGEIQSRGVADGVVDGFRRRNPSSAGDAAAAEDSFMNAGVASRQELRLRLADAAAAGAPDTHDSGAVDDSKGAASSNFPRAVGGVDARSRVARGDASADARASDGTPSDEGSSSEEGDFISGTYHGATIQGTASLAAQAAVAEESSIPPQNFVASDRLRHDSVDGQEDDNPPQPSSPTTSCSTSFGEERPHADSPDFPDSQIFGGTGVIVSSSGAKSSRRKQSKPLRMFKNRNPSSRDGAETSVASPFSDMEGTSTKETLNLTDPASVYAAAATGGLNFPSEFIAASLRIQEQRSKTPCNTPSVSANNNHSNGKTSPVHSLSYNSGEGRFSPPPPVLSSQQQLYSHYGSNFSTESSDRQPRIGASPSFSQLHQTACIQSPAPPSLSPAHKSPEIPTTLSQSPFTTTTTSSLGSAHNLQNMPVYQQSRSEFEKRQLSETHSETNYTSTHNSEGLDIRTMATSFYQHQLKQNKGDLYDRGMSRSPKTKTPSPTRFSQHQKSDGGRSPPPSMQLHTEEDLMACVFCSKSFYSHSDLERHIENSHSGNHNVPFVNSDGDNDIDSGAIREEKNFKTNFSSNATVSSSLGVLQDWENQQKAAFFMREKDSFTAPSLASTAQPNPMKIPSSEIGAMNKTGCLPSRDWDNGSQPPNESPKSPSVKTHSTSTAFFLDKNTGLQQPRVVDSAGNRIFHPEAFCELCNREFCNKYFLKTHKANKHGIYDDAPTGLSGMNTLPTMAPMQSLNYPSQPPKPPQSSAIPLDMSNVQSVSNTSPVSSPNVLSASQLHKSPVNSKAFSRSEPNPQSPSTAVPLPSFPPMQHLVSSSVNQSVVSPSTSTSAPSHKSLGNNDALSLATSSSSDTKTSNPSIVPTSATSGTFPEDYCEICQKTFCNKYYLKKHKYDVHGLGKPKEPKERSSKGNNAKNLSGKLGIDLSSSSLDRWNPGLPPFPPGLPPPFHPALAAQLLGADTAGQAQAAAAAAMAAAVASGNPLLQHFQNAFPLLPHLLPKPPVSSMLETPTSEAYPHTSSPPQGVINSDTLPMGSTSPDPMRPRSPVSPKTPAMFEGQDVPRPVSPLISAATSYQNSVSAIITSTVTTTTTTHSSTKPLKLTPEQIKSLGILHPDAYCELCCKEFCNKYFLRIHKANKHGIYNDETPKRALQLKNRSQANSIQQLALPASAPPDFLQSFALSMYGAEEPTNLSMRASDQREPGEREYKNDEEPGERLKGHNQDFEDAFCDICNKEFANKYWLKIHNINVHHLVNTDEEKDSSKNKSDGESSKNEVPHDMSSLTLQTLVTANSIATSLPSNSVLQHGEPATCELCNKELLNRYYLEIHKMKAHGIMPGSGESKERTVLAPISPVASKNEKMVKHEPEHNMLGKPFETTEKMKEQMKSHQSPSSDPMFSKPYQPSESPVPSAQTPDQAHTQRMALLMNGINPDSYCELCHKEFSSTYFLRTHRMHVHGMTFEGQESQPTLPCKEGPPENLSMALVPTSSVNSQRSISLPPSSGLPLLPSLPPLSQGSPSASSKAGLGNTPLNSVRVFCHLCNKELCNKYFLKTHMLNKHGILTEDPNMAVLAAKMPGLVPPTQSPKSQMKDKDKPKNLDWPPFSGLTGIPGFPPFPGVALSPSIASTDENNSSRDMSLNENCIGEAAKGLENDLNNTRYLNHFREACQLCDRRFKSGKWLQNHLVKDHGLPPDHFLVNAAAPVGPTKSPQMTSFPPGFPFPPNLSQLGIPIPPTVSHMLPPGFPNLPHNLSPNTALNLVKNTTKENSNDRSSSPDNQRSPSPSPPAPSLASPKRHECEACGETFKDIIRLQLHLIQDHQADIAVNMKAKISEELSKQDLPNSELQGGLLTEKNEKRTFSAIDLAKKFIKNSRLTTPKSLSIKGRKVFNCPNCKGRFLSHYALVYHLQRIHNIKASASVVAEMTGEDGPRFRCKKCEQRFFTRKLCKIHLKMSHHQPSDNVPQSNKRSYDDDSIEDLNPPKRLHNNLSSPNSHPSNGESDPPTAFGTPAKLSNQGSFIMQRFVLRESEHSPNQQISGTNFVTAVVYLPVKQKVTESVVTTFELSPSE